MRDYHNSFDSQIQCEEGYSDGISEEEKAEVMAMIAEESDGATAYYAWSTTLEETEAAAQVEQGAFEQSQRKDWTRGYTPSREGARLEGFDI